MRELMDAADINRTLDRISHQIIEKTADADRVVLLGIPSGGVPLAKRLATKIEQYGGKTIPSGSLDTTLYRDDLRGRPHRALQPTSIPDEGIDGATVVLVDDVLYSGRTIRAALDSLRDLGRPARIQLAVLMDRGHRELPIRADYVGKNLPTSRTEKVVVSLTELGAPIDAVTIVPADVPTERSSERTDQEATR